MLKCGNARNNRIIINKCHILLFYTCLKIFVDWIKSSKVLNQMSKTSNIITLSTHTILYKMCKYQNAVYMHVYIVKCITRGHNRS